MAQSRGPVKLLLFENLVGASTTPPPSCRKWGWVHTIKMMSIKILKSAFISQSFSEWSTFRFFRLLAMLNHIYYMYVNFRCHKEMSINTHTHTHTHTHTRTHTHRYIYIYIYIYICIVYMYYICMICIIFATK